MNRLALMKRRAQLERQRDAELRVCRAKWRSRINSIDRLLRAAAIAYDATPQTKPSQAAGVAASANALEGIVNGDMMAVIRQTLQHNRGFFTRRTLVEFINQTQPCSVTERGISHSLWSLRQLGEIRLVEKGNGRKPHTYLKL
jgi:hypothetical protein